MSKKTRFTLKQLMLMILCMGSLAVAVPGCQKLYENFGYTVEEAQQEVSKDVVMSKAINEGARLSILEIFATAITSVTSIAAVWLAKVNNSNKKLVTATIAGIEKAGDESTKKAVTAAAVNMGVADKLNQAVKKTVG